MRKLITTCVLICYYGLFISHLVAQVQPADCQDDGDASIGLDRKAWAGLGNTGSHSEGYILNFDLPDDTFGPCTKISEITVETTILNSPVLALPPGCSLGDYYENIYISDIPLPSGGASIDPGLYLVDQDNSTNIYDLEDDNTYICSPGIDLPFGGQVGVDIIPVVGPNGCTQNIVTNGNIILEFEVCVIVTIDVAGTPVAIADAQNVSVCIGQDIELEETAGDADSWDWSHPNGFSSTNQNPVISPSTAADLGTYTVTITDANGCTAEDDVTITQGPGPDVNATANELSVCPGQDIELDEDAGDAVNWSWSHPNGFNSTMQDPVISSSTAADLGTYTVTITDSNGCTEEDMVTITAGSPLPAMATAVDLDVCPGQDIELDEVSGNAIGWDWSHPNGFSSSSQDPVISSSTAGDLGTYTVTITDVNGCTNTSEVTITAAAQPTASATAVDTELCPGEDIELDEEGGDATSWSWSHPNGFTSSAQNPVISSITSADYGTYTVTVSDSGGCTNTAEVTIDPAPDPDADATAINDEVCPGQDIELDEIGGDAVSWSWSHPNGFTSTNQAPTISNSIASDLGTYTVTVTDAGGCTNTSEVTITAGDPPDADAVAVNTSICLGDDIELDEVGGDGSFWSWSHPNGFSSNMHSPTITSAGTVDLGFYTVTVTDGSGCTNTSEVEITADSGPAANATAAGLTVCIGEDILLMEDAGEATSWSWSHPNGYASTAQNPIITSINTNDLGTYTVTVSDGGTCTSTAQVTITGADPPEADAIASPVDICIGDDIVLNEIGGDAVSWSWSHSNGFTNTTQAPTISASTSADLGTYTVTVTDADGCTNTSEVTITSTGAEGCTDPTALNYDANAVCDDGSCMYSCPDPGTCDDGDCSNGMETWNTTLCMCENGVAPDPSTCVDDGDCSNGDEVWESTTCTCESINPPDPSTCVDDGDCTNGIETWNVATCLCETSVEVLGCTDMTANNFDSNATCDDGSCTYDCPDPGTCDDSDCSNGEETWNPTTCMCEAGVAPDPLTCVDDGDCSNGEEVWDTTTCTCESINPPDPSSCVDDGDCTNGVESWNMSTCMCETTAEILGCTDMAANNFDPAATCDDGSCTYDCPDPGTCDDGDCSNGEETWNPTTCMCEDGVVPDPLTCVDDGDCSNGEEVWDTATCTCESVNPPDPSNCIDDGDCTNGIESWNMATCMCETTTEVLGCTDMAANNFDPTATCDDGSCTYDCPDPGNCDDGDCSNGEEVWNPSTCMCEDGVAPDPSSCVDDGDCLNGVETWDLATCDCIIIMENTGCTDPTALNYDPAATCDDGSCTYDCPDPGNCDDGDCTNGEETWNTTTCMCEDGVAPDPTCEDDGDCSNGEEVWNTSTCTCESVNPPDPSSCVDDGDCTNGIETWNTQNCMCESIPELVGCTNPTANNYDPIATCDDGSCTWDCPMMRNIGDPCDDGDPNTVDDMVDAFCECLGEVPCMTLATEDRPCDDGSDCTINDVQPELPDGTPCGPCIGEPLDCMTGETGTRPCDDGNPATINDVEVFLVCDSSICEECLGVLPVNKIYLPTAIDITDSQNSGFGVYSANPIRISEFRIYDRWGNVVYEQLDIMSDDPNAFWSGRREGQQLLQGVYIYMISYENEGRTELRTGNLTLIY